MRVLIVGAGLAGLTLAARLLQQGRRPIVVERSTSEDAGYAIGLYPLGSSVLHGLGAYDDFLERGLAVRRYLLADGSDRTLQDLDMSVLTGQTGPMVMVTRADLVRLLESRCAGADIRRGARVASIEQAASEVHVRLDDGSEESVDAVIACDGIGSSTRQMVFGRQPGYDSRWLLWTWWSQGDAEDPTLVKEWWGSGCFFGVYPVPGKTMCVAGGPKRGREPSGADAIRASLRRQIQPSMARIPLIARSIAELDDAHAWPMRDVRARSWVQGRVALCGDAAAGFLPTAGVGASNAMRAAAGLADELSRCDAATIPLALELYEKRCRRVVEGNQTDSRNLARIMFVRRKAFAWARDQVARRYPAERMLGQIIDSMHEPF